ncbi:Endonuclease/exonuclease/phosphatase [Naematelia encephala]|uniref:Endonuclease/exonuclease/phosphatase n=1 Tax=Naematelia encephala TaxID=71784 RepID=A0A1Y2AIV2_9TREE|nr:Endonuclease/exonuclease/phosphatase [Naematelia encephala]
MVTTSYANSEASESMNIGPMRTSSLRHLHLATVNVRYDGQNSRPVPIPSHGTVPPAKLPPWNNKYMERPWSERRSRLVDALLSVGDLDIIGFQEVLHNQLLDIATLLGPRFVHVGVGRDDGKQAGEYSPIYFDGTRFELVKWKTIWLSPTPDIPGSKGWDTNLCRIATLVTLRYKDGGELVHVVNTHYDDQGVRARAESSLIIRDHAHRWASQVDAEEQKRSTSTSTMRGNSPVVLLGDFNSPPEEDGYKNITSSNPLPSGSPSFTFLDSYVHLSTRSSSTPGSRSRQSIPYGPRDTYTGFDPPGNRDAKRIDFIMLASSRSPEDIKNSMEDERKQVGRGGWTVSQYACVDNWVEGGDVDEWQGRWSDHRAVRATLERLR